MALQIKIATMMEMDMNISTIFIGQRASSA